MTRFDGALEPVAVATRSGLEESLHHGAGAILGPDGAIVAHRGDPHLVVYPRSALKPLQANAMIELGLDLPPELLAVACASHDGAAVHLDAVRGILDRYDLAVDDLANTPARPYGSEARSAARAAGEAPSSLQQNCSGKHAAMLATCRVNDWSIDGYLEVDHPLQQAITASMGALGCHVEHIGVDGCGAPTHAFALDQLAAAFATLARTESAVATAMSSHPVLVGGATRDVSIWMEAVPGLMAKEGAAGVMAAALSDGRAFAFKIADGSDDARRAVMVEALRACGVDVDADAPEAVGQVAVPVLGHGRAVGALRPLEWSAWTS